MHGAWVEIDLDALGRNIRRLRAALCAPTEIIFVVKSNAYGHGMLPVAEFAVRQGVRWLAVAYIQEALALRERLPDVNILLLGVAGPQDVPHLLQRRITPVIVDADHGRRLARAAAAGSHCLSAHLKIDTGMGRLGIPWYETERRWLALARLPGLSITGVCTHFATVDARRPHLAAGQIERFTDIAGRLARACGRPLFRHISSSTPFLHSRAWDCDAVRPGIVLYGYEAGPRARIQTEPILQWKTRVIQVKRAPAGATHGYGSTHVIRRATRVATISAGYADGYPRLLSNRGAVLIRGRRCPILGRISMNWITVDVGRRLSVRPGDEVVLLGRQGRESIWADELALQTGTISYEILTGINPLAERIYRKSKRGSS